jgi:RNA polymerase sigma-70 factor (ECF subfamily)
MEEKELVQAAQAGSDEAFAALVERYRIKMFNLAFSITRDPDLADDLAQDVFIKAFESLPKFKSRSGFGTWLYRIAVNASMDHLRRERRFKIAAYKARASEPTVQDDEILQREIENDRAAKRKLLHQALRSLPDKHRIILTLRDVRGLPYKEISGMLDISAGTVDSRLHRARQKLRKRLIFLSTQEGDDHGM